MLSLATSAEEGHGFFFLGGGVTHHPSFLYQTSCLDCRLSFQNSEITMYGAFDFAELRVAEGTLGDETGSLSNMKIKSLIHI